MPNFLFKKIKLIIESYYDSDIPDLTDDEKISRRAMMDRYGLTKQGGDKHILDRRKNPLPPVQFPGTNYKEEPELDVDHAMHVANDPSSHHKLLSKLSNHSDINVQKAVASNPNTHPEDLLHLAKNGHHEEVAGNAILPFSFKAFENVPNEFAKAIPHILNSEHFKNNPEIANDFRNMLNRSKNFAVRSTVVKDPDEDSLFKRGMQVDRTDFSSDEEFLKHFLRNNKL